MTKDWLNAMSQIFISANIPLDSIMIVAGKPDTMKLSPGQTEPTMDQIAEAYRDRVSIMRNIGVAKESSE